MPKTELARAIRKWFLSWLGSLAYFPTYVRGTSRAWVNIVFGETLLGLLMGILTTFAPSWFPFKWFFVAMVVLAGYFLWYEVYSKIIPKFSVSNFIVQPTPLPLGRAVFIQLILTCLTDGPVIRCKANLIRVFRKRASSGQWAETGVNEPSLLKWSSWNEREVDLEPGAERRLNVCLLNSQNPSVLVPESDFVPIRATEDLQIPAVFSFDIKLSAAECSPIYVSVEVNAQAWNEVSCVLWEGLTQDPAKRRLR